MRFRRTYLRKDEVIAASGTLITNLDVKDPIRSIDLEFEGTYDGTADYDDHHLYHDISKIEIIDGADVLFSMNLKQLEALNAYELGHMPYLLLKASGTNTVREKVTIFFGRGVSDLLLMLNPAAFINPQIKITYSFTEGANYWDTNTQKVSVIVNCVEEGVGAPLGFLMGKEIYSWTTATSGDETIDMPRDFPYRLIMPQKYLTKERADEGLTNIKLSCDIDRYVAFDLSGQDIAIDNKVRFGQFKQVMQANKMDAETFLSPLADVDGVALIGGEALAGCGASAIDAEEVTLSMADAVDTVAGTRLAQAADQDIIITTFGLQPHHTLCLPIGEMQEIEQWFDPTPYRSVRLIVTQGGTSGTGNIVLQQLRRY